MRVFGGVARTINDPKGCSLDTFSYFPFQKEAFPGAEIVPPWCLAKTVREDLVELKNFYDYKSGGLMLSAFELEPDSTDINELVEVYTRAGFKRMRYLFSLKKDNFLKAIFILNISDIGLNLSELTNCITVIVIDPEELPMEILYAVLASQIEKFSQNEVPVLLYPESYMKEAAVSQAKAYNLWVLSVKCADPYLRFIHRILRRVDL